MFPIADDVPRQKTPIVTWGLIALNLLVFAYEVKLGDEGLERLVHACGVVPRRFADTQWGSPLVYTTFLTSQFLHGDWLHLIVNLWTFWIFGDNVEDRMGPLRYLFFYLFCGTVAALVHVFSAPGSDVPTIGASGAIAGVLGAYLVLFPRARVLMLVPVFIYPLFFELPAVFFLGLWFLSQFRGAFFFTTEAGGGVAWWAHIGGFVAGIALFWFFLSNATRERRRARRRPR